MLILSIEIFMFNKIILFKNAKNENQLFRSSVQIAMGDY